jgi:hypothetical protein
MIDKKKVGSYYPVIKGNMTAEILNILNLAEFINHNLSTTRKI